ncbi:hypothetical protein PJF56_10155 [Roseofilum sp. BLCC_M91]|uniref:Uncharacterized protein n=1 Tax=Roseofilum halophilum BLCC-M91 TaxID=3022259 RepID=A0ABT7BLQ7_9CYAN|nr:hypothetical protein [Roseofilum halophilum]MDJ1179228.1 hypothetical protein [Roseofilum halophilum BLCC-M91]
MTNQKLEVKRGLRAELKRTGLMIGNNDLLIASHALSLNVAIAFIQ